MKLDEIKAGDSIILDGGFDCAAAGAVTVQRDDKGLYFPCRQGQHYLDGQEDGPEGVLVGIHAPGSEFAQAQANLIEAVKRDHKQKAVKG